MSQNAVDYLDRLADAAAAAAPPPTDEQIRALRRLFLAGAGNGNVLPLRARPSRQDGDHADTAA